MDVHWEIMFDNDPMLPTCTTLDYFDDDVKGNFSFCDPCEESSGSLFEDLLPPRDTLEEQYVGFEDSREETWVEMKPIPEEAVPELRPTVEIEPTVEDDAGMEPEAETTEDVARDSAPRRRPRRKRDSETSAIFGNGKPKLYSVRPFKNPQRERARQNAINAKMNREKKKMEAERLRDELENLRDQNLHLGASLRRVEARAGRAERELAAIRKLLVTANVSDLLKAVSSSENH